MMNNRRGASTDIFIFIIFAVILLFFSGMFIYMGNRVSTELHTNLAGKQTAVGQNYTEVVDQTFGQVNTAYNSLYWISLFLITAMIISMLVGSYYAQTKPIVFVPYIFIVVIAVIVSVGISNAYQLVVEQPDLASTFAGFLGSNYIMYYLPMWVAIIGILGGIIMYVRFQSSSQVEMGGVYG